MGKMNFKPAIKIYCSIFMSVILMPLNSFSSPNNCGNSNFKRQYFSLDIGTPIKFKSRYPTSQTQNFEFFYTDKLQYSFLLGIGYERITSRGKYLRFGLAYGHSHSYFMTATKPSLDYDVIYISRFTEEINTKQIQMSAGISQKFSVKTWLALNIGLDLTYVYMLQDNYSGVGSREASVISSSQIYSNHQWYKTQLSHGAYAFALSPILEPNIRIARSRNLSLSFQIKTYLVVQRNVQQINLELGDKYVFINENTNENSQYTEVEQNSNHRSSGTDIFISELMPLVTLKYSFRHLKKNRKIVPPNNSSNT
jgi:hypothetical protein